MLSAIFQLPFYISAVSLVIIIYPYLEQNRAIQKGLGLGYSFWYTFTKLLDITLNFTKSEEA